MTISTTPTGRDFEIDRQRFVEGCSTRDVAAAGWELVAVKDEAKVLADAAMHSPVGDCSPITTDCSPNAGFTATERIANSVADNSYDPLTAAKNTCGGSFLSLFTHDQRTGAKITAAESSPSTPPLEVPGP
jgi:hypothetical protein